MNGSAQRNVAASPTRAGPLREPGPARQTMKAIVQDHYGSQDVLQLRDIDKPVVGEDDVLVRVHAAGLRYLENGKARGKVVIVVSVGVGPDRRGPEVGCTIARSSRKTIATGRHAEPIFGDCFSTPLYVTRREPGADSSSGLLSTFLATFWAVNLAVVECSMP